MKTKYFLSLCVLIVTYSCKTETPMNPNESAPVAKKVEKKLEMHGDVRIDNYYWMNDREDQEVIDHLNRENDYLKKNMAHTEDFQNSLFEELKARIKEDDESVPYKYNGYWYITKFETGKDYPIYMRKKETLDAEEELIVDCNTLAEGHSYFRLNGLNVSPNNEIAAFGIDTVSRRRYTIHFKNLKTGEMFSETIGNTTGGSTWANDNKTLFYTKKDMQTLRSDKIYKHKLGENPETDELIYFEEDETYLSYVYKTKSEKFIVIGSSTTLANEYRILNADDPDGEFRLFNPRKRNLEHNIYHHEDEFYIVTNKDGAKNFKLMKTPDDKTSEENWVDVIGHRDDVLLQDIDTFKDYLVVSERKNGLNQIHIKPWDESKENYYIPFDNETYTAYTTINPDYDTDFLRYSYTSLSTPPTVIDFNMSDRTHEVKKVSEVPDGKFNSSDYETKRVWAKARDGKDVAISMIYKKGMEQNGKNPLLLYSYGSYGSTMSPSFRRNFFSLVDRGFIFAIAHIRGSQYLGREWYEDGKLFNKINTFTDFVDCSKFLIEQKYTSAEHHYALGGSAGGLLMGAVLNMAPELYNGVIAAVPFVDVVTTMLDDSIPLTTFEYDEWGNPNNEDSYRYMLSYSPYDQVKKQNYPNILVTTGLHDSQVQYWEPAKWVAKLREMKTDSNILLLRTNMETGHGGASGRFESLREDAQEFAFLLDLEGITE
ncbi:MAG: S9 family peptidase [Flavobacteriaceae bacterium]|nr:S9 family peptidase [Flavobacteriaceae bacterium]